jgi:hypothetical protein
VRSVVGPQHFARPPWDIRTAAAVALIIATEPGAIAAHNRRREWRLANETSVGPDETFRLPVRSIGI